MIRCPPMNSEQRYLLAVFLSFLVLIIFYVMPAQKTETARRAEQPDEAAQIQKQNSLQETVTAKQPELTPSPVRPEETYDLESDMYLFRFTSRGAGVSKLEIRNWSERKVEPVTLIDTQSDIPAFAIDIQNQPFGLSKAHFQLEQLDKTNKEIDFVLNLPTQLRIRKHYELVPHTPAFRLVVEIENLSSETKTLPLELFNEIYFGEAHGHYDQDQQESFLVPPTGKIRVIKSGRVKQKPFILDQTLEWQALTRKYFAVIVKPAEPASGARTDYDSKLHYMKTSLRFPPVSLPAGGKIEKSFLVYAGPEYYKNLKSFDMGFEQTLSQGTWGLFRHWLFLSLQFCEKMTGNYGFAILLMTFILKILFSPFTHMSFESMRKMQVVQPKVKALQTQYKNDPTRMNKEMMELYKRHKVNPMGGCLPMLIQIPIFIGFYQVLAQYVELKGEALWWIKDLTEPDRLARLPFIGVDFNLLPILMIITMIAQQRVTPKQSFGSPQQAQMMQWMPVAFGFFFYALPSGLVLYWTLNNLLTVIHQMVIHHRSPLEQAA
ncbi:MAG: hypothetical protein COW12_04890 [Candidatus Omnitrophica bacterium CG12_big_fil_rev_8_21_14_0_65_45_16]|nr:MAG: hypothetical protein COW12_04890 [Candidatus Omnitrophica bacterium CG12_big_fil_rev_8_21_14_0_65_45_16]